MGLVQQAVLDFDEEIQAPWRPRLVAVAGTTDMTHRPRSSGRSSARVGICRPPESVGGGPVRSGTPDSTVRDAGAGPGEGGRRPQGTRAVRRSRRGVRLTRRARRLAVVLALAVGVAIGSWVGPVLAGDGGELRLAGVQSVVVQPGDTLWSIASEAAGTQDVREVVARIQELNDLRGTVLMPGQVLELP